MIKTSLDIQELIEETLSKSLSENEKFLPIEVFLRTKFCTYSQDFVKRLEKFGCTELADDKLILYPWVKEFAKVVSELRTYHVLTTACAQIGKTLINTLFMVDFLVFVNLNVLWIYPSKTQVDNLVPGMFLPVVRAYIRNIETYFTEKNNKPFTLTRDTDRTNNSNYQVRGATAHFRYTSTSAKDNTTQRKGLATVGGSASSISANILFIDERSQILPDALGTVFRRLDAARLPGGLIREVGTPGAGLGIESAIENANYHFYPHVICSHCDNIVALSPKGCLLKPIGEGKYLSLTGRPIEWFSKDKDDPIQTAYIGCPICASEISEEERINAHFRCIKTGISYAEYERKLPQTVEESLSERKTIAVHLSPLLRVTKYNLAAYIIDAGLNSESVKDFSQQLLGFPSEVDTQSISRQHIKAAINRSIPDTGSFVTIAGVDTGRRENWMYICRYYIQNLKFINGIWYYTPSKLVSPVMAIENATRQVIFAKDVSQDEIPFLLQKFKVDHGFIDNEPERIAAYEICQFTVLNMADQKKNLPKLIAPIQVMSGALEMEAYGIDTTYFQDMMLNVWTGNNISIFDFDVNDRSPKSLSRHLCAMEKDSAMGQWIRPNDHIDDLFYAGVFCEAGIHQFVDNVVTKSKNSIMWYNQRYQ